MNQISRREFLKLGAAGAAGAVISGCRGVAKTRDYSAREIEELLRHYEHQPEKLAAARFLAGETRRRVAQLFPPGTPEQAQHRALTQEVLDVDAVTAVELSDNIEYASLARQQFPWAQELDARTFTQYVLPYRNGTMPVLQFAKPHIHWRELMLTRTGWKELQHHYGVKTSWNEKQETLDGLANAYKAANKPEGKRAALTQAIRYLNTDLWAAKEGIEYKRSNAQEKTMEQILEDKGGRCSDLTHFGLMVLRAHGIPATTVRIPAWAKFDDNHQVLGVKHDNDWLLFDGLRPVPETNASYWYQMDGAVPKVYVEEFGTWDQASKLVAENRKEHPWHIGFYLGTRSCLDLTRRFTKTIDIPVSGLEPNKRAYVSVLNNFCSDGLAAVAVENADSQGRAVFKDMGCRNDILYFTGKDAVLARDNGTSEVLRGSGMLGHYTLDVAPSARNELCKWAHGRFGNPELAISTGSGKGVPLELEPNTVYAFRITTDSDSGPVAFWDRPFVPRKDRTVEKL